MTVSLDTPRDSGNSEQRLRAKQALLRARGFMGKIARNPLTAIGGGIIALLLLVADLCAQQLFMPYQLPVGVVTVSLGGIYLIVLLIQESRKK